MKVYIPGKRHLFKMSDVSSNSAGTILRNKRGNQSYVPGMEKYAGEIIETETSSFPFSFDSYTWEEWMVIPIPSGKELIEIRSFSELLSTLGVYASYTGDMYLLKKESSIPISASFLRGNKRIFAAIKKEVDNETAYIVNDVSTGLITVPAWAAKCVTCKNTAPRDLIALYAFLKLNNLYYQYLADMALVMCTEKGVISRIASLRPNFFSLLFRLKKNKFETNWKDVSDSFYDFLITINE